MVLMASQGRDLGQHGQQFYCTPPRFNQLLRTPSHVADQNRNSRNRVPAFRFTCPILF